MIHTLIVVPAMMIHECDNHDLHIQDLIVPYGVLMAHMLGTSTPLLHLSIIRCISVVLLCITSLGLHLKELTASSIVALHMIVLMHL